MERMIEIYNEQAFKWERQEESSSANVDDFLSYDDKKIKWSSGLKQNLKRGQIENSQKKVFDSRSIVRLCKSTSLLRQTDE